MDATTLIIIKAQVEPAEHSGLIAAAEQLSDCLNAASNTQTWKVRVQFYALGTNIDPSPPHSAIIVSLLPETKHVTESITETKARWLTYLGGLQSIGPPVFVRTVFRHVRDRTEDGGATNLVERIRRLNRMAVELSHELGIAVIEIDRAFAHIGGRALESDYGLTGPLAAEVSGHTTVWSLLSFGLDDIVDPGLQEKAKELLGGLSRIDALVSQRRASSDAATEITSNVTDTTTNHMLVRYYDVAARFNGDADGLIASYARLLPHPVREMLVDFRRALVSGRNRLRAWGWLGSRHRRRDRP
jgi:hypothetical protein